jgi:HTH-type transcriptional regulator / antitoxin HigA
MHIQPIRTEADYDAYESRHFPINTPDPIAVMKFQMEQQRLTRKNLEPMIGTRARVSEVLTGERALTLPIIRRLHAGLHIPVDLLIGTAAASRPRRKKKSPAATLRTGCRIAAKTKPR